MGCLPLRQIGLHIFFLHNDFEYYRKFVMNCFAIRILAGLLFSIYFNNAWAVDTLKEIRSELSRPSIRGGIVYKTYCVLCHGIKADGKTKAIKLYDGLSLAIRPMPTKYYEKIIRGGGSVVGKSAFMPSWQKELSSEQIRDVVAYLGVVGSAAWRGQVVYKTNCILCHGVKADGTGRASVLMDPPPANLTMSDKNDEYKTMIITLGGAAMGRSAAMPVWGEQLLQPQEIEDVVAYLKTVLVNKP